MRKADFYLIDKPRFREDPLLLVCELARRAFDARLPTLIFAASEEQAEALDQKLWEFDEDAFIAHQVAGDEDDDATPVLIVPPGLAVTPRALAINLRETALDDSHATIKEVVPADPAARDGSRARWRAYQQRGYEVRKFDM
jgi:DNA polymerase-3 subunit chi